MRGVMNVAQMILEYIDAYARNHCQERVSEGRMSA